MTFNRTLTAATLALTIATIAHAQTGTGSWWWEASTNNGSTWTRGTLEVPQSNGALLVRASASWSTDSGRWFAGTSFDAIVENAAASDSVSSFQSLTEVPFSPAPIASRFGSRLKIDDPRDTLPPGEGLRAVPMRQFSPVLGSPSAANPIALFQFTLTLDGSIGDRRITEIFLAPSGGNTTDRFMWIYTANGTSVNYPLVTQRDSLIIRVIPTPASTLALPLLLIAVTRRCR